MKKHTLRFSEHQRCFFFKPYLTVEGVSIQLSAVPCYLVALERFHEQTNGRYYELIHNGIRFKAQVGVIQVGNIIIEVVPKIDDTALDTSQWHDILLEMLGECAFLQASTSGYASLRFKPNRILDLYFEKYVAELESICRHGLVKQYRNERGNVKALKGRLVFGRNLQVNLLHPERFYTAHTVFDTRNVLNQVLRQALETVAIIGVSPAIKDRLSTLLELWPKAKPIVPKLTFFDRLSLHRNAQHYTEALLMAKMILLNYSPDLRAGNNHIIALMFDMNSLWEEFILGRLKRMGKSHNWRVSGTTEMHYWRGGSGAKKLIPDIVIDDLDQKKRIIIDTKWKKPGRDRPDDNDLRQLLTYKLFYQADQAYLLYPTNRGHYVVDGEFINAAYLNKTKVLPETIKLQGGLLFFNLVEAEKLMGQRIFQREFMRQIS